jgi:N-acetylglucosamine kinase-like BadF-type ATPase
MITIGFDGGGSRSRFLIKTNDGEPEYFVRDESLKYSDKGIDPAAKRFKEIVSELVDNTHDISAIGISLSGASDPVKQNEFRTALRKEFALSTLPIHIESDSTITLQAAYPEEHLSGLLVIAGTGSVYLARTTDGEVVKTGGWGRVLGDEGSGYWIGLQALKHYCKALDGMEEQGALFEAISEQLEELTGGDMAQLRSQLYANQLKPSEFAPIVFDLISKDEVAHLITVEATNHLARHIEALCEQVADRCDSNIVIHGGLFNSTFFQAALADQVASYELRWTLLNELAPATQALQIADRLTKEV